MLHSDAYVVGLRIPLSLMLNAWHVTELFHGTTTYVKLSPNAFSKGHS
jgi:hypothetical protein